MNCATEVGSAMRKRIQKNSDKLFTFLKYDGVPWNNNNAEHAVRAFTRLRNGMSISAERAWLICDTIKHQQTLRSRD